MSALVLSARGDLLTLLPLLVLGCYVIYVAYLLNRRRAQAAAAGKGSDDGAEEVYLEDEQDAKACEKLITKDDDAQAARRWWSEHQEEFVVELVGATSFEVEGRGTVKIDGERREIEGTLKFDVTASQPAEIPPANDESLTAPEGEPEASAISDDDSAEAPKKNAAKPPAPVVPLPADAHIEIRIDGKVRATLPDGGSARLGNNGEVRVTQGSGRLVVSSGGSVDLAGAGRYWVSNCSEVSASILADDVVFEAHDCVTVFGGHAREFFAYDCQMVYAKGRGLAYRCKKVSAQDKSLVYAAECQEVHASNKAKVRHRKCVNVTKSDEAVLEPVI
jgi:hypothetical protein